MTGPDDVERLHRLPVVIGAVLALLVLAAAILVWSQAGRDEAGRAPRGPDSAAGTLVSAEPVTSGMPPGLLGWRITYVTRDAAGEATVASSAVVARSGADSGPRPVLAIAHGSTGIASHCAPSLTPSPYTGLGAARELVADGWVVVSPDYVGLGQPGQHGYLVGPEQAHAVLDAVRAAGSLLELQSKTVVWGHSQGGHAALWTAATRQPYAPEVDLVGVAATAPATDLAGMLRRTGASLVGKVVASYLAASWSEIYGPSDTTEWVTRESQALVEEISQLCLSTQRAQVLGLASRAPGPVLQPSALEGRLGKLLSDNIPRGPFDVPVLVAQGGSDVAVPVGLQRDWVAAQCAAGSSLQYSEYAGLGHASLVAPGSPLSDDLVAWTRERVAGAPAEDTCDRVRRGLGP